MDVAARERRALAYALASVALWSTVATGFKLGLRDLAAVQLLLLGCVIALVFFAAARGFVSAELSLRQHLAAGALGLVNPFAYYLILFEAYDRLPAQIAQPLNFTWAIALALLAMPLLRQRLSARGWIGVVVGYVGVVVILTKGEFDGLGHFDPLGVALALGSALIWAWYWIMTVRLGIHPVPLMLNGFAVATCLVTVVCWATVGLPALNLETLGYGAWVGLIETGVAFLLWQRAMALTKQSGKLGALIFLAPFLSLVLIAAVLGEAIHPSAVAGLALIAAGLVLSRWPSGDNTRRGGMC
ncbi:MAG: DMT family transporter [Gammaproteobacteria bacterium]|nr:DMT family transporter [Gammaproteobacteria bacterium]